ncbi:MAG TPA: hypothetical protein DIC60_06010 [Lachnospiraceae bacterium]|nr:hypothetical protein [Lachnospiraceae bacterium]
MGITVGHGELEGSKLKSLEIFSDINNYGDYHDKLMDFINSLGKVENGVYWQKLIDIFAQLKDISFSMRNSFYHNECTFMPVPSGEELDRNNVVFERVYLIWEQELNGILRYDHNNRIWDIKSVGKFSKDHDIEGRKVAIGFDENQDIKYVQYSNKADKYKDGIEQIKLSKDESGGYSVEVWESTDKKPSKRKFRIDDTKLISTKSKREEHINFLVSVLSSSKRDEDTRPL